MKNIMPWMYILECADGSYYVGSTVDLQRRLAEHDAGLGARYTKKRLPVRLAYAAEFGSITDAYSAEKQVQNWSRAKREALIRGDFSALTDLGKKDFTAYHARRIRMPTERRSSSGADPETSLGDGVSETSP